jgi:glycosyltransferase involved in cell wall biosynthesis
MTIIIVGTAYPLRGGIAHYNALLASVLSRHHTVETITFKRQYPGILFPGKSQQETGATPDAAPAPMLIDSLNPLNWIAVGRMIRRRRPDLLIFKYWLPFFGPCFGTIARVATRGTDTKVIFICDNVIPHEHRPGDRIFTRYAFRTADGFIVQSDAVQKDLLDFWPQARFRNVPHPVYNNFGNRVETEDARETLGITAKRVLLFFGYVRAYKGLHVLLDAMPLVPPDVHLLVVGEFYEGEEPYRAQVRRLGLERRVTFFADYVPNDRVKLFFSAADAVVLPYITATQSGITQIAYNFDLPVIATHVGGLAEVVKDRQTGLIVAPGDANSLAAAIAEFYATGMAASLITHIREAKQEYSWENLAAAIESLAGVHDA